MTPTAKYLLAYGAYVAGIHMVPGPWKTWDKGQYVDWWTTTHLLWGHIGKRMGVKLPTVVALSVLNEFGEAVIRKHRPDLTFGSPESAGNIALDVAANYVGYKL